MGQIVPHPAMQPTSLPVETLQQICDFRTVGYHRVPGSAPHLFYPRHVEFYDNRRDVSLSPLKIAIGGNVVGFAPRRPMLRVVYDGGDWSIIALFPDGYRLTVAVGIPTRGWISAALWAARESLFDEFGVWCATAQADWALK